MAQTADLPSRREAMVTLANAVSLSSLACSLLAILQASQHRFDLAGVLFLLAMVADGLDGFVARKRNTAGPMGMQLDSLIDVVSFGVAPAVIAHLYLEQHGMSAPFWLLGGYVACTAIRLGRFNVQVDKSVFFGLNSPSGASTVILLIWVLYDAFGNVSPGWVEPLVNVAVGAAALMMVSPFQYVSTKKLKLKFTPVSALLFVVAVVVAGLYAPYTLYGLVLVYAISGPLASLRRRLTPAGN